MKYITKSLISIIIVYCTNINNIFTNYIDVIHKIPIFDDDDPRSWKKDITYTFPEIEAVMSPLFVYYVSQPTELGNNNSTAIKVQLW
jgi:hypothetical protein